MTSKPTLLLVDDEERILRSLRMLFMIGYNVRMTTDANEAIDILKNEPVHVIVSDQRMPIMQGSELLRIAREVSPNTMRILLTGYSDFEASVASLNEGEVFRYLMKPWVAEDVKQTVAEAAAIAEQSFAAPAAPAAAAPVQKPRVLIMDQDETTVQAVQEVLREKCEIIRAADVQHAMDELSRQDIAVVVADVTTWEGNTVSMLKAIKRFNPKTQSIVVTSVVDTERLVELINQAQISRFLPKPLIKGLLSRNLEYVLNRFHELCSAPVMQQRQTAAPISNEQDKKLADGFFTILTHLRAKVAKQTG